MDSRYGLERDGVRMPEAKMGRLALNSVTVGTTVADQPGRDNQIAIGSIDLGVHHRLLVVRLES